MTFGGWAEIVVYCVLLGLITPVLGGYMATVFSAGPVLFGRTLPEQDWKHYARSVLVFSVVSVAVLYVVLRIQGLPYDVAFNTSSSFVTNTNWQFYGGETTMSNVTQMGALAVQNFASAGVGIAVVIAFIRGLASRSGSSLGNFYADLGRCVVYVLLPLSIVVGLFFASQGVIQSLSNGPVASQESIKLLGTNGGGFFNVNSAHPFENPSWLTNVVQLLAILAIPASLTATYGRMVGNRRQGWAVFGAMMTVFVVAVAIVYVAESHGTPAMHAAGIQGPNMEGKESRFGIASSSLYAVVTTAASCGAVNAAMESFTAFGSSIPMAQMMTGENIWGGVGSGLYGMLVFVILAVFISGLMVGRTPEFLGKKIEAREIKLAIVASIGVPVLVLFVTALAIATSYGKVSIFNSGPQGFSETLYAYVSQGNNNGSAFAGYTGFLQPKGSNSGAFGITFADLLGGLTIIGGRFLPMLAVLSIGGALAGKRVAPPGPGTLRTDTPTFVVVLIGVVLLVALLTFVPALLLGPVVQGFSDQLF